MSRLHDKAEKRRRHCLRRFFLHKMRLLVENPAGPEGQGSVSCASLQACSNSFAGWV